MIRTKYFLVSLVVFFGVLLYFNNVSRSDEQELSAEEVIIVKEKAALDRWCNGDPYGYIELAAEEVTYFAEGCDTLIQGYKAFKEVNAQLEGKIHIPRYEMLNPQVRIFDNIGILIYALNNYSEDGEIRSKWKSTEIYKLIEGDWMLIHSHWTIVKDNS